MIEEVSVVEELNQLGENLLKSGNVEAASEYFLKAQKEDPNFKKTYMNLGSVYANQKRYEEAIQTFSKVLLLDKKDSEAYVHLARVHFLMGKYAEGIVHLTSAIANGDEDAEHYFDIGRAYLELHEEDKALRNINLAIQMKPIEGKYYVAKARFLVLKQKYEEALETLAQLNQYCPDAYEAYHYSFLIYMQLGEYGKADEIINMGTEKFPLDVSLYCDKLKILNVVKEFDAALELIGLLEQVPGFQNEERNIRMEQAKIYLQTEKAEEAVKLLEKVINMDGADSFEAHYLLMNTYLSMEKFEQVVSVAQIMIDADDHSGFSRSAYYYQAMCLKRLGKENEAKEKYRKAIAYYRVCNLKYPGEIDAYLFRALCLKDMEEYQKALDLLDYVLKLKTDYAPAYLIQSNVLKDMGRMQEAKDARATAEKMDTALGELMSMMS